MNPSQNSQSTSSTEGSLNLVSPSLWQGTKGVKKITGTCGLSFRGWSKSLDHVGSLLRMCLESYPLPPMTSARIWKASTTKSGYGILKLSLSVLHTGGHECSLWPTPTVNGNYNRKGLSKTSGDGLATVVRRLTLLPTPTANDAKNNGSPSQRARNSAALIVVAAGSLNPEWVELLMGFPRGWTDIGTGESQK